MAKQKLTEEQKAQRQLKIEIAKRKESEARFEKKRLEKIEAMKASLKALTNKKFVPREKKTKTLTKEKFKQALAKLESESADLDNSTLDIQRVANWTANVEPLLLAVIATAKEAKDKAIKDMKAPKDKRLYRRLISSVEKTGFKAKDFTDAIHAQQNRIANLVEDLDITEYLTK
jgi:hypothetical protein